MTEFCFSTPRIIMQRCFASITTATPDGWRALHECVGDLGGELFLDLQAAREDVDDPRDFGETDHFAVGDVGDVGTPDEWEQMMFAHRIKLDVLDHHDLARVGIEDRAINHVLDTDAGNPWVRNSNERAARPGVFSRPCR